MLDKLIKHQEKSLNDLKELLGVNQRVAVVRPTGYGKSKLMFSIINDVKFAHKDRVLIIEPSDSIITNLSKFVKSDKVIFITYQKLCKLKDVDTIRDFFGKVNMRYIFLDEMHRAGAKEWSLGVDALLSVFKKSKVVGLTATPYREDGVNVIEDIFDGNQISELNLSEAIVEGLLPAPTYITALYDIEGDKEFIEKKIMQSKKSIDEKTQLINELKVGVLEKYETMRIPTILKKHLDNHVNRRKNMKFIVFCSSIKMLKFATSQIKSWFESAFDDKKVIIYKLTYGLKNSKEILNEFSELHSDSIIDIIICVDMLNEGVHVDNITGVVMLRKTSSERIYLQQLGRCISIGVKNPIVFDLINNCRSIGSSSYGRDTILSIKDKSKDCCLDSDIEVILNNIYDYVNEFKDICEGILRKIRCELTDEQDEIIKMFYPEGGYKACQKNGLNINKRKIKDRANQLGITCRYTYDSKWTQEEIDIIIKWYNLGGYRACQEHGLSHRSADAIRTRAKILGVNQRISRTEWSEEDDNILKDGIV